LWWFPLLDLLDRLLANYSWAWNDQALQVFQALPTFGGNPYEAVRRLSSEDRQQLQKAGLESQAQQAVSAMEAYLATAVVERTVAYFSAEFGIHECLPLYSGGLGVLAGDHLKSASDLNLPLVGVGLVYRRGYFHQKIDSDGMQREEYPPLHPMESGFRLAADRTGRPARVSVPLNSREVHARVWRTDVGRVPLYLLDTDLDENNAEDRFITSHLYGGDREMRIRQEIVLGIGGLRALRALGYDRLETFHLNEGHAAFLALEAISECRQPDEPLERSRARAAGRVVFTTHTPVPAGHDVFPPDLVCHYLGGYAHHQLRCSEFELLQLGGSEVHGQPFSMTELALSVARAANGVSARHGEVSRAMFPGRPIDSITNGVHHLTWTAQPTRQLYDHFLPGWRDDPRRLSDSHLPEGELRRSHQINKVRMVERLNALQPEHLDPELLTIGFARRFATYKRADLLFHDADRLAQIGGGRIQLIVAGKAHPQDEAGKHLIQAVIRLGAASPVTAVFIPDYDLALGKLLVAGVDVWLNNPRRPMEASGTSGMKASLNGVPNLSVLDGWWIEGYDGTNGWAIGPDIAPLGDPEEEDARDAESLYMLLSERVIPEFYDSPGQWAQRMKRAVASSARFTTHRMVGEYARRLYRL
jgi:glycogen phosphorylase